MPPPPSERWIAAAQGLPRTVNPVRTREEIDFFLWCLRQDGVVRRPAKGDATIDFRVMEKLWNTEVRRKWDANETTPKKLRRPDYSQSDVLN